MENKEIKENKYEIEYTKQGDYYMPNLVLEKEKPLKIVFPFSSIKEAT